MIQREKAKTLFCTSVYPIVRVRLLQSMSLRKMIFWRCKSTQHDTFCPVKSSWMLTSTRLLKLALRAKRFAGAILLLLPTTVLPTLTTPLHQITLPKLCQRVLKEMKIDKKELVEIIKPLLKADYRYRNVLSSLS